MRGQRVGEGMDKRGPGGLRELETGDAERRAHGQHEGVHSGSTAIHSWTRDAEPRMRGAKS